MASVSDLPERIAVKIEVSATGCWLWLGRCSRYGFVRVGDRVRLAHRVVYELLVGPVAPDHDLHHRDTCEKRCVNPEHVTPLSRSEHRAEHRPTHCQRGHELAGDNVYTPPGDGRRRCRTCRNERKRNGR